MVLHVPKVRNCDPRNHPELKDETALRSPLPLPCLAPHPQALSWWQVGTCPASVVWSKRKDHVSLGERQIPYCREPGCRLAGRVGPSAPPVSALSSFVPWIVSGELLTSPLFQC